jgi:hypothetical protein
MSEQEHLAECANEARRQAALLPHGKVRDALLVLAAQYEARLQRRSPAPVEGDDSDRHRKTLSSSTR